MPLPSSFSIGDFSLLCRLRMIFCVLEMTRLKRDLSSVSSVVPASSRKWNLMLVLSQLMYSGGTTSDLSKVWISRSDSSTVLSGAKTRALWQYLASVGNLLARMNS